MSRTLVSLLITTCLAGSSSTVNILLLEEIASPSHHGWFRSVTNALASKGYNLTIVSPDQDVSSTNIHYIHTEKVYQTLYSPDKMVENNFVEMGNQNVFRQILQFSWIAIDMCDGHTKSNGWKQLENYPNDFKFDVIIHDYIFGGCLISFANKFKNVPLIGMTPINDNCMVTNYAKSSVIPSLSPYLLYNRIPKTFLERTFNFVMHIADNIILYCYTAPKLTAIIKESTSFKDTPSTLELGRRSVIYLTNYEPSVDGVQQLLSNVIPVGGLQIKPANPLPEDLQTLADNAKNGLILFSLGTNVQIEMLGKERIIIILEAFRKLSKYSFVWKINLEKLPIPLPSNVVIRKWIPQNDILAHNNTKVFITHAGLMSTQEAIYHGVPMLGVPIFADQFINIHKSVAKGFADVLHVKDFSIENLISKLEGLLTQSKYRTKIRLASVAFRDQKETPLERAVWWIDWVMRNPNSNHFENSANDLNFLQLQSLDVILFLAVAAFLSLYGLVWFFKLLLKCIFGDRQYVEADLHMLNYTVAIVTIVRTFGNLFILEPIGVKEIVCTATISLNSYNEI